MRGEKTKKVVLKVEQVENEMKNGDPLAEYYFSSWRLENEEEHESSNLKLVIELRRGMVCDLLPFYLPSVLLLLCSFCSPLLNNTPLAFLANMIALMALVILGMSNAKQMPGTSRAALWLGFAQIIPVIQILLLVVRQVSRVEVPTIHKVAPLLITIEGKVNQAKDMSRVEIDSLPPTPYPLPLEPNPKLCTSPPASLVSGGWGTAQTFLVISAVTLTCAFIAIALYQ